MLLGNADWWRATIGGLIECDGVAVALHGILSMSGSTPPRPDIEALLQRLDRITPARVFAADRLAALHPEAVLHADEAAGVLSIPISRSPQDYILLFRRECLQQTVWAGDPEKPASRTDDGLRLSPRKSFEAFRTIARGRALPFTERNKRTANVLRTALIEVILEFSHHGEAERRRTAQRQELLIAELNHRVRNILSLIRGLISQSGTEETGVAAYVEALNGRIQALARAQDQITRVNWGPGRVSTLFDQEISAFVPERDQRFTLNGPEVLLHPQAFSTLSLVVHELATNSAKYGSLSDRGSVAVTLELKPGDGLSIEWRETGGPAVKIPRRRGFGSVIIERVVPFDLKGAAQVRYETAGLEADFFIPEEHIAVGSVGSPMLDVGHSPIKTSSTHAADHHRPLEGMAVLLLEDNLILALETEDLLHALGARAVFLASSIDAAALLLEKEHLDFAILDVYVGTQRSLSFALSVRDADIPYVFATGYGESLDLGPVHSSAHIVSKPFGRQELGTAIGKVLGLRRADVRGDQRPATQPETTAKAAGPTARERQPPGDA